MTKKKSVRMMLVTTPEQAAKIMDGLSDVIAGAIRGYEIVERHLEQGNYEEAIRVVRLGIAGLSSQHQKLLGEYSLTLPRELIDLVSATAGDPEAAKQSIAEFIDGHPDLKADLLKKIEMSLLADIPKGPLH